MLKEDGLGSHTWGLAIRVHPGFTNYTFNMVTVGDGLSQGFEKDGAEAFPSSVTIRIGVPHEGSSVR